MNDTIQHPSTPTRPWSSYSRDEAQSWAEQQGLPRYRGRQLYDALQRRAVQDVQEIHEFPQSLRNAISAEAPARALQPRLHLRSRTDRSEKALMLLADGATVETVLIPSGGGAQRQRFTVCVSSQVGCPAACSFCATGLQGFTRNLTPAEIVDQVMYFAADLHAKGGRVTNVVFMGMGEPFLNTGPVRQAIELLTASDGFGLGERHITVSTVGIVPQIRRFVEWGGQVNLAISLHAPDDHLRGTLVPYNQHFPIGDIMRAVREYVDQTRRRVSFEYVLLRGVNDSAQQAQDLSRLLGPLGGMAHVNVIPWNPFREGRFIRSEGPDASAFVDVLIKSGTNATIRYSKGLDISAACGQLRERDQVDARG